MNIDPPGTLEWIALLIVGALAGAINTLRSYASRGTKQALLVGAVEGATALFVTVVSFLTLYHLLPEFTGRNLPALGLIGVSGVIAHIGLRQSIKMAIRWTDQRLETEDEKLQEMRRGKTNNRVQ